MGIWWRRLSTHSVAVFCGALILSFSVGAQTNSATLSGTVRDSTGAIVPDVAITVSSKATGLKRQTTSSSDGSFTLSLLPPGTYSLQAERDGFSSALVDDIELSVAGQLTHDVVLE